MHKAAMINTRIEPALKVKAEMILKKVGYAVAVPASNGVELTFDSVSVHPVRLHFLKKAVDPANKKAPCSF